MKISAKEWVLFILIAILCFGLWFKLGYPQFSLVNLSIDKAKAYSLAENYLNSLGVDIKAYSRAIVFDVDDWADRYLQRTVGFAQEEKFVQQHNYELFYWKIRFFRQFQKEEYVIRISPRSGKILTFDHRIEDVAFREPVNKDIARAHAKEFLRDTFGINLEQYDFHEEQIGRYDNRVDYSFSWEKKKVYIPWKKDEGGAKLLMGATVSGNEIRRFYGAYLDVPEKFIRYIERQLVFGHYLLSFYFLMFIFLLISSISIVVKRKQNVVARLCKKWFFSLAIFLIIINLISIFNDMQGIIINYPTSVSFASFIGIYLTNAIIGLMLLSVTFIMPGIAGESLRSELFPDKQYSSFVHYLRSTFYSRAMTMAILFGYILFFILLGLQAGIFYVGQRYLGVWKEWLKLTQFSSAYMPLLGAFVIGVTASLNEEVIYRLFGISWGKKYLKNTVLAIVFISLVWGFGHSGYEIFPVWFRGIELSLIGLLFGFMFIRYGLIPLIVAHYLFDVFWGTAAYILSKSSGYLFSGSLFVLSVPLIFACIAYFVNKEEKESEMRFVLSSVERYNLGILITFVSAKKSQSLSATSIKEELIAHNWDITLVDLAINEVFKA